MIKYDEPFSIFILQEILDATVLNYEKFRMVVAGHENLRLVDVSNWAGLGAVQ